jgi:hypothetical protein
MERYLGISIFAHLGRREILLDGKLGIRVKRKRPDDTGDLPDWVACDAALKSLTVAEAKGCQEQSGPQQALARAWKQADRIDVLVKNRKAPLKRIAIATRWGLATDGPGLPILSVRDPEDDGDMSRSEREETSVGIARLHAANLLKPLGYPELANALTEVVHAQEETLDGAKSTAQRVVNGARPYHLAGHQPIAPEDALLGNWVTRAGPIGRPELLSAADQESLRRLELRPVFVGLERRLVMALIAGNIADIRSITSRGRQATGTVRTDGAATWMVDVGDGITLE